MENKITRNLGNLTMDVEQFQTKIEGWKQLLNSLMEENILMKNMLADILKNNYGQNSLEEVEDFQTQFIIEDEVILSLRKEINDWDNLPYSKVFKAEKMEKSFETNLDKLDKDITNSITRFRILKSSFDGFRSKISNKS